jgi:hypothetical protein
LIKVKSTKKGRSHRSHSTNLARYHIVSQFKQRERVVIIDPAGTDYLSPLLQFSEARDLHIQQAELATMASRFTSPRPSPHSSDERGEGEASGLAVKNFPDCNRCG